jgi:hypothetical protein
MKIETLIGFPLNHDYKNSCSKSWKIIIQTLDPQKMIPYIGLALKVMFQTIILKSSNLNPKPKKSSSKL